MKFDRLLLPLDLEWPSMRAVHQASLLARHFHSRIAIVSVVRPTSFLGLEVDDPDTVMETARREDRLLAQNIAQELGGISVERLLARGDPGRVILETARERKADLIVMGPHGHEGTARLMGSVTHNILNAAEAPMWTYGDWDPRITSLDFQTVICGVDFTPHDRKVIEWAAAVAAEFKSQLVLAHATPDVGIYGPGGYYSPAELTKSLDDAAAERIRTLIAETGVRAKSFVRGGEVHEALNTAASEFGGSLLVIGRRPAMGMLGGHAYKIVSHARVPVLSV